MIAKEGRTKLEQLFGLDLRSLAVLRIGLALLILTDLFKRAFDLQSHYSDEGILPRSVLIEQNLNPWRWSIHLFSGQALFQGVLFILAGAIAIALLFGYRTRFVTIISWALLLSLQLRNPLINNAGDVELRLILFWSIFLPLGAHYSVDRALNSSSRILPKRLLSPATVALTLQVCFVYWFTWSLKSDPIWHTEGSAVYYALNLDYLVTPIGKFLLNFPSLLVFLTFTTLWFELLGPFLLFVPFRTDFFRFLAVMLFVGLHLGFGAGLLIGLFPYVSAVAWLAFLPSGFWQVISQRFSKSTNQEIKVYYNQKQDFSHKIAYLLRTFLILPKVQLLPAQQEAEILAAMKGRKSLAVSNGKGKLYFQTDAVAYLFRLSPLFHFLAAFIPWKIIKFLGQKFALLPTKSFLKFRPLKISTSRRINLVVSFLFILVSWWNFRTIAPDIFKIPKDADAFVRVLGLDQTWNMFTPHPPTKDGWYVIPGKLRDGTEIDLFQGGESVSWEKPKLVSGTFGNMRWRKYIMMLHRKDKKKYRLYYGRYLCRSWNNRHKAAQHLDTFEINFMLEKTLPDYQTPKVERLRIWKHTCSKGS